MNVSTFIDRKRPVWFATLLAACMPLEPAMTIPDRPTGTTVGMAPAPEPRNTPPRIVKPVFTSTAPTLDLAVETVVADVLNQLGPARNGVHPIVIDPLLDAATGQQTNATVRTHMKLTHQLSQKPGIQILTFDANQVGHASYVVTGTLTSTSDRGGYRLRISLSDLRSGLVVARAIAPFDQPDLDTAPTRFFKDSPSLVRDRSIEGYLRTVETEAGNPADALYIEELPTAAVLAQAHEAYNAERWQDALTLYSEASRRSDGQQLRTFNGMYLANLQLGQDAAAEDAFSKIVVLGLATNNLAVKLLFRPGSNDEFWADPKVNGMYPTWLRHIARATKSQGICIEVVGHTSHSGPEELNLRLSRERADFIRKELERQASGITSRIVVKGVGFNENIVGTGADDESDALDRRVEFKVVQCERLASAS